MLAECDLLSRDNTLMLPSSLVDKLHHFSEKSEALIRHTSYRLRRTSVVEVPHIKLAPPPKPLPAPDPPPPALPSAPLDSLLPLPPGLLDAGIPDPPPRAARDSPAPRPHPPPDGVPELRLPSDGSSRPRAVSRERLSPRILATDTIVQASDAPSSSSKLPPAGVSFSRATLASSAVPSDAASLGDQGEESPGSFIRASRHRPANSRFRQLLGKWKSVESNEGPSDLANVTSEVPDTRSKITDLEDQIQRLTSEVALRQSQLLAAQQRFSTEIESLSTHLQKSGSVIGELSSLFKSDVPPASLSAKGLEILSSLEIPKDKRLSLIEGAALLASSHQHLNKIRAEQSDPHISSEEFSEDRSQPASLPDTDHLHDLSLRDEFTGDKYLESLIFSPDVDPRASLEGSSFTKKSLLGGNLSSIVYWLISDNTNPSLLFPFLYTFREYASPAAVCIFVLYLYDFVGTVHDPEKAQAIRSNILRFFSQWLSRFCFEPREFSLLHHFLQPFLDSLNAEDSPAPGREITEILVLLERGYIHPHDKYINQSLVLSLSNDRIPKPILSKTARSDATGKSELMSLDPLELARQMTLLEASLFSKITPIEFLSSIKKKHPTVQAIVDRFNQVSHWVATEIILAPTHKTRAVVIKFFIKVANACRQLNNFNTLLEITAGLNMSAVRRLKKSWLSLPSQHLITLADLEKLMDHRQNYSDYRAELRSSKRPTLPYFGIFLRDLTFIDVGNQPTLPNDMPNFERICLLGQVIDQIQFHQQMPYLFQSLDGLQNSLKDLPSFDEESLIHQSLGKE